MQGRSAEAFRAARKVVGMVTPEVLTMMPPVEIITPTLLNTYVRFGRWDAILREPAPTKRMQFAVGIWRYARGLAFNAKNQPASARTERDSLAAIVAAYPNDAMIGFNSGKSLLTIARRVLEGELAAKQGKTDEAIGHFTVAIGIEDSLHYDEPSDWTLPVRQNLGAVLLAAGRASDAEAAYRADLKINPENGWALLGLAKSLHAQKKDSDAAEADARFKKAWARADVQIAQSRY
jgi:tetratricopeptide (TPR) repeat protein